MIGNALAVDIGQRNGIIVNQNQPSCAASGQGFNTVGAYASNAENGYGGGGQARQTFLTDQKTGSGKFVHESFLPTAGCHWDGTAVLQSDQPESHDPPPGLRHP